MPLSKATKRRHVHTRDIKCDAYEREDGLWDIEGVITDTKSYSFDNYDRGGIAAGEPLHQMRVRLTIDDQMEVKEAEAVTEASPYDMCGRIAPDYSKLVGLTIGRGWRKNVMQRLGGVQGCTHISDLVLGPLAVTAFQAVFPVRVARDKEPTDGSKPATLNTCHALSDDSPVVEKRWPTFFRPPAKDANSDS